MAGATNFGAASASGAQTGIRAGYLIDLTPGGQQIPDQAPPSLRNPRLLTAQTDRLVFQFNPETLKHSIGITWNGQIVPGHSHRRLQWGGGGAQTWKFTLQFHLDSDDAGWVKDRLDWLQSMTCGTYDDNGALLSGPHHVRFIFGEHINQECIVLPFEVTMDMFDPDTLMPTRASVDLTLEEWQLNATDARSLRR